MPAIKARNKIIQQSLLNLSEREAAATNGDSYHELREVITEKDILLSLNTDIASVRDKKDILKIIHPKLKQLFGTDDIFICCLDAPNETLNPVVRVGGPKRTGHPDYERTMNANFPIHDGFIDRILSSKEPLAFDLEKMFELPEPPGYLHICKQTGLKETLSTSLYHAGELIGILTLWSEKKNFFNAHHKNLIAEIADQISIIIINILANAALEQRDKQNEILLLISNEIAAIRNKSDLGNILSTTLKQYIPYDDSLITVYDHDHNLFEIYVANVAEKRMKIAGFKTAAMAEYFISHNDPSGAHFPFVVNVEKLYKGRNKAVTVFRQAGIKEFTTIKLVDGDHLIGLFVLLCEKEKVFTESCLYIMQRISYQISIAVVKLLANEEIKRREAEKSLLLSLSNDMALVRGHEDLARIIDEKLKKLFFIKDFTIVGLQETKLTYGAYLYDKENSAYAKKREYLETLFNNFKFEKGLYDVVLQSETPVVFNIADIMKADIVPGHIKFFHSLGIEEIVGAALRIGDKDIGILWIQPEEVNSFDAVSQNVFQGVCSQISVAFANIVANEEIERRQEEKEILLSLSNNIASIRNRNDLLKIITLQLKKLFNYNDASIIILDLAQKTYSAFVLDMQEKRTSHEDCLPNSLGTYPINDGICDTILQAGKPVILNYEMVTRHPAAPSWALFLRDTGLKETAAVVLREGNTDIGAFFLHSETEHFFQAYQMELMQGIAYQLSVALANVLANEKIVKQLEEINVYKNRLEEENQYLQQQIETAFNYNEILGASAEIQKIFHLLSQVAVSNSTVLISGETGTGKELIARAIHNGSPRKDKLMVKVNCASMPVNLIESELFGHERGSFTGAIDRRIGKFELANNGTLFLDEIGEMPLELQAKLLRALQEKEIERIGGKGIIKTDVRIIVATNRDLQKEVQEGRFRSDLYYRINVFPIHVPPLRERKDDIPILVTHFIERFSRNTGKKITGVSKKIMQELIAYEWPGNVRELEHFIERSILLTEGSTIKEMHLPTAERKQAGKIPDTDYPKTIEENERDHILEVIRKCNGKIAGMNGAAQMLGVPVSTLTSKMKKLGITKAVIY